MTTDRPFEILVHEHQMRLMVYVRAVVRDAAAAEDLVQECFLAAWRQLADYDDRKPFHAWLRGIARNKLLEYARNLQTRKGVVSPITSDQLDALANGCDQLIPGRGDPLPDTLAALRDCIASALNDSDREIVLRNYRQGDPCRVIAESMGHSVEAVRKRLQRARKLLHDCIVGKVGSEVFR